MDIDLLINKEEQEMNWEEYLDEYKLELSGMDNEDLLFELGSLANMIGRFEKMNEHDQNTEAILEKNRKKYKVCQEYIISKIKETLYNSI